jgi:antitoxin (DNA-binding transcriptional repressor) of toxin-antitoxin stability system
MENAYGIEAARAKLGDIADHVRSTGQIIPLTRHGRTVAVIGPANAVKPAGGVEVTLYFPHTERLCVLPALPRTGEQLVWVLDNDDADEGTWNITEVQWHLSDVTGATVGVSLEPADDHTKQLMDRQEAERLAAVRSRAAKVNELRESVRANRPEPLDDGPLRDARTRQDAAMRDNQEPADRTTEK